MSNTEPELKKKKSSFGPAQLASYLADKAVSKISPKSSKAPTKPVIAAPTVAATTKLGQGLYDETKKQGSIDTVKVEVKSGNLTATAHAGAETNKLSVREGAEFEEARQARIAAEAKAVVTGQFGDKAGLHGEGKAQAKAKASAEVVARAQGGRLTDAQGKTEGYYAKGELSAHAEAEVRAKAEGKVAYSDQVSARGSAEVRAGVAADAHARGSAAVTSQGVGAEVSVGASLSASVGAKVEGEVQLGDIGLAGDIEVDATALLAAGADGTFVVGENGINLQYSLGAAAGVEFTGKGSGSASLNGRTFVKAEGEAGVTLGYVVGAKGRFQIKGGKIVLNMGLAAPAIIPAGVTVDVTPEMNLNPLANVIVGGIADIQWALDGDAQKVVTAPDKAKDKLIRDLQVYSEKKIKNLKTDAGTEHYANLDSVQAFVKDRFPTKLLSRKDCDSKACDDAIREAIIATIKATPGKSLEVDVAGGKVTAIRNQLEPARIRGKNAAGGNTTVEADVGGA